MIPHLKRTQVIESILKAGVYSVNVAESKGKETGQKPIVGGARGTASYVAEYNRFYTITAIVADSKLRDVVSVIMDVAYTGSKEDGMLFITAVDEAYSIGTRQRLVEPREEEIVSKKDMAMFAKMSNEEKKRWILTKAREVK